MLSTYVMEFNTWEEAQVVEDIPEQPHLSVDCESVARRCTTE